MDQDQASTELTIKTPTTLETIPEDVAEVIAAKIKDWAKVEGDLEQREKQRKLRDSALRAVALSCRRTHQFYIPILLESVTLDFINFFPFCQALLGNQGYGDLVKSLTFNQLGTMNQEEHNIVHSRMVSLSKVGLLGDPIDPTQVLDGFYRCKAFIFQSLSSIQSLIILGSLFNPRSFKHLSCFPSSLKRLYLPLVSPSSSSTDETAPVSAKNVIWLLSFGALQESCLGFTISTSDFDFLYEHHQAFERTSDIKKLSLFFRFVYKESDRKTWWRTSRWKDMEFKSGNMKTEALKLLLSVVSVNQVECLELFPSVGGTSNPGGEALLSLDHLLLNLEKSLGSLRHLRLFGFSCFEPAMVVFPPYLCLRTISLERNLLCFLAKQIRIKLPSSLERLILPYYLPPEGSNDSTDFLEDNYLAQVVNHQSLPSLKEVFVLSGAIGTDGEVQGAEDSRERKAWINRREQLENDPIFKSGRVKLRKYSPGEMILSENETFMSNLIWLSQF